MEAVCACVGRALGRRSYAVQAWATGRDDIPRWPARFRRPGTLFRWHLAGVRRCNQRQPPVQPSRRPLPPLPSFIARRAAPSLAQPSQHPRTPLSSLPIATDLLRISHALPHDFPRRWAARALHRLRVLISSKQTRPQLPARLLQRSPPAHHLQIRVGRRPQHHAQRRSPAIRIRCATTVARLIRPPRCSTDPRGPRNSSASRLSPSSALPAPCGLRYNVCASFSVARRGSQPSGRPSAASRPVHLRPLDRPSPTRLPSPLALAVAGPQPLQFRPAGPSADGSKAGLRGTECCPPCLLPPKRVSGSGLPNRSAQLLALPSRPLHV